MGGIDGIRGYLVQALIALIESFEKSDWDEISFEPYDESEKIDIKWIAKGRTIRLVQVKSSINLVSMSIAKEWAREIHGSDNVSPCELIIVGHVSATVLKAEPYHNVTFSKPKNLDIQSLVNEAAHLIDEFCFNNKLGQRNPEERKMLVTALCGQLFSRADLQESLPRSEFVELLGSWISLFKPPINNDSKDKTLEKLPGCAFFTGRTNLLKDLEDRFENREHGGPLTIAITGLGGQGKTQTAIQLLRRFESKFEEILWVDASSNKTILTDLAEWAKSKQLISVASNDAEAVEEAFRWLRKSSDWFAVLDNLESIADVPLCFANRPHGQVLITTRHQDLQPICVQTIDIHSWSIEEAVDFLMKRCQRNLEEPEEYESALNLSAELGCLPLALEQAAAYIVSKKCTFASYLKTFRNQRLKLLARSAPLTGNYDKTVETTWTLNVSAIREINRASFDLLVFSSFLGPDKIPFELIVNGADFLGRRIKSALSDFYPSEDETLIDDLLSPLVNFSLATKSNRLSPRSDLPTYSLHRLVQEVTRTSVDQRLARVYRRFLIMSVAECYPSIRPESVFFAKRLMVHAIALLSNASAVELENSTVAQLMHRVAHTCEFQGDFQLAYSIYSEAYSIRSKILPSDDSELGLTQNNIGVVLLKMGLPANAEPVLREALIKRRRSLGSIHPDVAQTYRI